MGYPLYHSQYTAAQIEAAIGKGPRVNASGFWEVWNVSAGAYESTGVGAGVTPPTVVTQVSQMTNHGYVYIYNGSETGYTAGYWYYWDGSAWTAGGAYQVAATDPTLSITGAAADAKATGDKLGELKSALNHDTEVVDDKIGKVIHTDTETSISVSPSAGGVIGSIGSPLTPKSTTSFYTQELEVNPFEKYYIVVTIGSSSTYPYYVYALDSNNVVVDTDIPRTGTSEERSTTYTIPVNVTKLVIMCYYSANYMVIKKITTSYRDLQTQIEEDTAKQNQIGNKKYKQIAVECPTGTLGGVKGNVGGTPTITVTSSYYHTQIEAIGGAKYIVDVQQSTSDNYPYYAFALNESGKIIDRFAPSEDVTESGVYRYTFTVPENTKYLLFCIYFYATSINVKREELYTIQDQINYVDNYLGLPATATAEAIGNSLLDNARVDVLQLNKNNVCLNFCFITDTHANTGRADNNLDLFAKAANERWCDFACHGGDMITVTNETTQDDYFEDIGAVLGRLGKIYIPVYCPEGNHDVNGKNDDTNVITPAQWYTLTRMMAQDVVFNIDTVYSGYFYKDFSEYKIRVIVLDYYYGHDSETAIEHGGIYGEQMKWLATEALMYTGISDPEDWSILILVHNVSTNTNVPFWRALTAFLNGTTLTETEYTADYSQQGAGTICAIVKGHEHSDTYTTIANVNVIGTTCGYISSGLDISVNDFAFDIFTINPTIRKINATRIGRGNSREFTY